MIKNHKKNKKRISYTQKRVHWRPVILSESRESDYTNSEAEEKKKKMIVLVVYFSDIVVKRGAVVSSMTYSGCWLALDCRIEVDEVRPAMRSADASKSIIVWASCASCAPVMWKRSVTRIVSLLVMHFYLFIGLV